MNVVASLSKTVGKKTACETLAVPRATFYRHLDRKGKAGCHCRPAPPLALSPEERQAVLDVAHKKRFWDATPYQIYATLLDEGRYLASIRTFYRVLSANQEVRERRKQVSRPRYQKPELLATEFNEVWSWDIVFGISVQNPEIFPGIPGEIWIYPGCPDILPRFLQLVQYCP